MAQVTECAAHPDFAGPADIILISADRIAFHISASDLTRCSEHFRRILELPQRRSESPNRPPHRVTLEEDALTLEILLKLGRGRPAGLGRIASLRVLDRMLSAATKYGMVGARDVLLLLLRLPHMQENALYLYAIAGRYGEDELERDALERLIRLPMDFVDVAHVDVTQLSHMLLLRQQRIERFCSLLLQSEGNAPFRREYSFSCPYIRELKGHPDGEDALSSPFTWMRLVAALQNAFIKHPSVAALDADPAVRNLVPGLHKICCPWHMCLKPRYNWLDIRARLSALMDAPDSSASCTVIA